MESRDAAIACTCGGNHTVVDGNAGHNPFCPANPKNRPEDHPPYLDDDGLEGVQFVRHDLAATDGEALQYLKREGLWWTDDVTIEAVWMAPRPDSYPEDYYDVVPEHAGVVRYWRLAP